MASFDEEDGLRGSDEYPSMETDGIHTDTSAQQIECQRTCELNLLPLRPGALDEEDMEDFRRDGIINASGEAVLLRDKHENYLLQGLDGLGPGFISLDASRPWLIYWIVHSLDLLDRMPQRGRLIDRIISTIASCQDRVRGGFGGGPQQLPHSAPLYASLLALLLIGTPEAYAAIDRPAMYRFLLSLKHSSGGFRMHDDGEVDARGTYTVIAVASLTNMLTPELTTGVAEFALRCQTYEGGFGGEPWNEAHGGYTFCAFAALIILGRARDADLDALDRWLCARQMRAEGGFQGRTNKLVDGCYSLWQGGSVALLDYVRYGREMEVCHRNSDGSLNVCQANNNAPYASEKDSVSAEDIEEVPSTLSDRQDVSFDREALQKYILMCSQLPQGGLRDKPGKSRDFYHTCYTLSGLSVAQHCLTEDPVVFGDAANLLRPTNPAFNMAEDKVLKAMEYFESLPSDHSALMSTSRP